MNFYVYAYGGGTAGHKSKYAQHLSAMEQDGMGETMNVTRHLVD